jgi:hypothetical protein
MVIVERFPAPPTRVLAVFTRLQVLGSGSLAATANLDREPAHVPRPWDPGDCDDELRFDVWEWCEDVASWFNREFAWRGFDGIPPCWPQHPYLAHEIAVLASQRYLAAQAIDPRLLDDWLRVSLPAFVDRMSTRTGDGCLTAHTEWPGAAAFHRYADKATADARRELFRTDTHQPRVDQ